MKTKPILILAGCICAGLISCRKDNINYLPEKTMQVCISDIPFRTELFLRIPYTLKLWEYEKEGLKLQRIVVLDQATQTVLMAVDSAYPDPPALYKEPLPVIPFFTWDDISHYYISLQLPIPLAQNPPASVVHRFELLDTVTNLPVVYTGAIFSPRLTESPVAISSPVKGSNWLFTNQSNNGYHFNALFFLDSRVFSFERFAFDNMQFDDGLTTWLDGDPLVNESYFNYRDTLYAVAAGRVVRIQDGLPENSGNAHNVTFQSIDEYAGNYLILDIGGGLFVFYCHCAPYSFLVAQGDTAAEGAPLALLGNSGNSSMPHLHFQIGDRPELWGANGVPFVLKSYVKTADMGFPPVFITPTVYTHSMMEWTSIVRF
jgi:hypothetical protein